MKKRKPKLYLVGQDPADVFDDLDRLRTDLAAPVRRQRAVETFARIPHDRALELFRHGIGGSAWMVLIELDRLVLKQCGKNPVVFWSPRLRAAGLIKDTRKRASPIQAVCPNRARTDLCGVLSNGRPLYVADCLANRQIC